MSEGMGSSLQHGGSGMILVFGKLPSRVPPLFPQKNPVSPTAPLAEDKDSKDQETIMQNVTDKSNDLTPILQQVCCNRQFKCLKKKKSNVNQW